MLLNIVRMDYTMYLFIYEHFKEFTEKSIDMTVFIAKSYQYSKFLSIGRAQNTYHSNKRMPGNVFFPIIIPCIVCHSHRTV